MSTPPIVNTSDLLSLELLMNKSHYKQYLAKTNPSEHKKTQEHAAKYRKYKTKIAKLAQDYIKFYDSPAMYFNTGNSELQEIFTAFTKKAILHFESIEHNEDDADKLFDISPNQENKPADYEEDGDDFEMADECAYDIEDTDGDLCINESQTEDAIEYNENVIPPDSLPLLFKKKNTAFDIDLLLSNRRKFKKI